MDAQATAECCALRTGGLLRFFGDLPDPRAANVVHKLTDLFAIAICAVICGAEGWVDVELFARSKQAWLFAMAFLLTTRSADCLPALIRMRLSDAS